MAVGVGAEIRLGSVLSVCPEGVQIRADLDQCWVVPTFALLARTTGPFLQDPILGGQSWT